MANKDLNPPEVDYGKKQFPSQYDCKHHMAINTVLYDFSKVGVIPLFIKNFSSRIPEYVDGEISHIIDENEINRFDLISWKYYKTPELFWLIFAVNNIINPFDVKAGAILRILPKSYIEYKLLRYYDEVM